MEKNKIGIWGQFGDGGKIADGQAVRTTIITNELKIRYGENNVNTLNTDGWQKNPLCFLWKSILLYLTSEKVIIFPADNGFKAIVPIYNFLHFFVKRELYDVVIGGYLPGILKNKKMYIGMLQKYKALFVQTINLKKDLQEIGMNNIKILSNLKRLNTVEESDLTIDNSQSVKVCTLSRINEVKGIDDAVETVKMANKKLGGEYIHLDIYGMIMPEYKEHFEMLIEENMSFTRYGGIIDYDRTTETLKDYFAMLFPTFYYGEGFPGNVVDAFNAGLPIIATDWRYNKDVITPNVNGFLVSIKNPNEMSDILVGLYKDRNLAHTIACNNVKEAKKYTPDKVLKEFYEMLDN